MHQRLLIWGLKKEDWLTVLKNHWRLLKPEGWVQLVECQWVDRDHPFNPLQYPNLAKQTRLQKWSTKAFGMDLFIAYKLEDYLKDLGFQNVSKEQFDFGYGAKVREEVWKEASTNLWVDTFRSFGERWPEGGIPEVARSEEEFYQFLGDLKGEIGEAGYAPKLNYIVGQKPQQM